MWEAPETIGRYRIIREIGAGGMGVVFLAEDQVLQRQVALKVLRPQPGLTPEKQAALAERFLRECRVAGRLTHPNIAKVYDAGEGNGCLFLTMELVHGDSLRDRIDLLGPMGPPQAVDIARQIATALSYAHSRGVVHRDIKPDNISVSPTDRVKVMDFGVARLATDITVSSPGTVIGSPSYMSPEQIQGGDVDGRTDVFTLGTVLYEMLTGRRLFQGSSVPEVAYKIVHTEPDLGGSFPPRLRALLRRALAKDPRERFATAEQMLTALRDPLLLRWDLAAGDRREDDSALGVPVAPPGRSRVLMIGLVGGYAAAIAGTLIFAGPAAVSLAAGGAAVALTARLAGGARSSALAGWGALCAAVLAAAHTWLDW